MHIAAKSTIKEHDYMAVTSNNQVYWDEHDRFLDSMKGDSVEAEIARTQWYLRERYARGHMGDEEQAIYEIDCAWNDLLYEGYNYSQEQKDKIVQRTINLIRGGATWDVVVDTATDILGGLPVTIVKALEKIWYIWRS